MESRRLTVCHDCLSALRGAGAGVGTKKMRFAAPLAQQLTKRNIGHLSSDQFVGPRRLGLQYQRLSLSRRGASTSTSATPSVQPQQDLNAVHARIQALSSSILKPTDEPIPPEQRVLYVLEQLDSLARSLADAKSINSAIRNSRKQETTATSALLGSVNARHTPNAVTKATLLSLINQQAEAIVRHPNVFITPSILKSYVELQSLLYHPSSFPDVFDLYARKPIPKASASERGAVDLQPATPNKLNTAIDSNTANTALTAAITAHDLPLAMDIIQTTFCTSSFRNAKALRQALVPVLGLAIAPLAAYTLASQFGTNWNLMLDPQQATRMAFAGIMTYVGAVSCVGYVAITTANDQMDRVTWAQGVPLWERWTREEERAAIDRVAGAWGFKSADRRGEEEGAEWDGLREWVGRRGMVLDRVELMEGME